MTIERGLRLVAGTVVLVSLTLGVWASPYWLLLTAFVGLNLFQSAFTNWFPMVWLLARLGLRPCVAQQLSGTAATEAAASRERESRGG
jgi:hypothetical protein